MGKGFSVGMIFKIEPADPVKHAALFKSEFTAGTQSNLTTENQNILTTSDNVPDQKHI